MLEDQTKFGRSTFELYGMQRLQKLEVFVCQERLKLLGAIKITRELQHGKITKMLEQQALRGQCTLEEMEEEVYRSQLGIFDVSLEMLKEEEDILRRQKDILDRAWQEELDEGIFYDAVEERDQLEDELEMESSGPMSRRDRLKLRLNRLYRKRAILRNKRKACVAEHQKKVKRKEEKKNRIKQHHAVHIRREEIRKELEMNHERIDSERRKTLERLREYKKKYQNGKRNADGTMLEPNEEEISRSPSPRSPRPSSRLQNGTAADKRKAFRVSSENTKEKKDELSLPVPPSTTAAPPSSPHRLHHHHH
ncbi:hypothetical protein MTO96_000084 [Rhipicephalus appendiculatus]